MHRSSNVSLQLKCMLAGDRRERGRVAYPEARVPGRSTADSAFRSTIVAIEFAQARQDAEMPKRIARKILRRNTSLDGPLVLPLTRELAWTPDPRTGLAIVRRHREQFDRHAPMCRRHQLRAALLVLRFWLRHERPALRLAAVDGARV